ncbi:MAG: hypothetical protein R2698_12165 [Microthrixaceae bacterium]
MGSIFTGGTRSNRRGPAVAAAVGVFTIGLAGCTPSTPTNPPSGDPAAACTIIAGATPRAWEVPAAQIATSPDNAKWADRIWLYADNDGFHPGLEIGVDDQPANDYSLPLYCSNTDTTTIRAYHRPAPPGEFAGNFNVDLGTRVPWSSSWRPSDGKDALAVVFDASTGHEVDYWRLSTPKTDNYDNRQLDCQLDLNNVAAGFDPNYHMCAATLAPVTGPDGQLVDVRTYLGNFPPGNGAGLPRTAGLTTPKEVKSGRIAHALKFAVGKQASMTGPPCPSDVTSPYDPRIGTTCGVSVAPASKLESRSITSDPAPCTVVMGASSCLAGMIPDGTRWVVDISDAEIDQWLDGRGFTGRLRETARVFAVALRDFGSIQTETSSGPATWQAAGGADRDTAAGWRELGLTQTVADTLLDGLVTRDRIRVLEPPVNHCPTGDTQLACWASSISYPGT